MSSSSQRTRSRYRFGFKGKRPSDNPQIATTDEIFDSLTRQAKLMAEGGKERTLSLQTLLEVEPDDQLPEPSTLEHIRISDRLKKRTLSQATFAVMLVGGLVLVWIYSRLSQNLNLHTLAALPQTVSRAGFADWQKIALVAIFALIIALLVQHSKSNLRSHRFSAV